MQYADVVIKDTSAQHTDRTEIKGFECLNGITFPEEPILYKIFRVLWSVWWLSVRLCFGAAQHKLTFPTLMVIHLQDMKVKEGAITREALCNAST
jgi:hypothetical protein